MSLYNDWIPDTEYSFSTIGASPLPQTYSFVKLNAVSNYTAAKIIGGSALYSQWRRIYPYLGATVVDDPNQHQWLIFSASNGEVIILANVWIEGSSVSPVSFRQERITLTNTNEVQLTRVKEYLNALGIPYVSEPIL